MAGTEDNVAIIERLYACFETGDLDGLVECLAEDCEWQHAGPRELIPWAGTYRGHAGVIEFFGILDQQLEPVSSEPPKFIAQGDTVIVLGRDKNLVKETGNTYEADWAHVFTLKDGKIAAFRQLTDTASELMAVAG